ncbi:Retrotransposon protein, unclassified, putative [Theobroma cacao]|uniref:Retrotransposon protein, unclassified, putative n=1 Tax=Theobroma cacao TaxID=3641 RepID=A0A061DKX4_THECC|nr:Retrotransposon protein, unclassified, putative [Theobroma cacao]
MEMARCLMFHKDMPKVFWVEAVNTANYILNLTYSRVLPNVTTYELWYEQKPNVSHMKVYGSVCYAKVLDEKRSKLDLKSTLAIFIGYSDLSKGYRLYDLKSEKIFISKDEQGGDVESLDLEDERLAIRGTRSLADIYERCNLACTDLVSFAEAQTDENWKKAMDLEMDMILKNGTWELVNKPNGQNVIGEDIYIAQPEGYVVQGFEHKVCKLVKALFVLKQALRAWYERIDEYFRNHGFNRSLTKLTLYVKGTCDSLQLIVALYVDDLLITGLDIFLHQLKYVRNLLKKFNMEGCKTVDTPLTVGIQLSKKDGSSKANGSLYRSIIGSLLYLSATRLDIMFATCLLSKSMQTPSVIHFKAAKRILRYVKGTSDFGLVYLRSESSGLQGYTDNDWAGSVDDSKSTGGFCFSQGVLALCGMNDAETKPVLFCSCNDNTVRLYDLPSFTERGRLYSKREVRVIHRGPFPLFFTGYGSG